MSYWLPKLHNKPIKLELLPILALVCQQNFLPLPLSKTCNYILRKSITKDPVRKLVYTNSGGILDKLTNFF